MFLETNNEKILEIFMKKPTEGFQIRDIVRLSKLGNPTVTRVLAKLKAKGLVKKTKGRVYPYYEANLDSYLFKKLKLACNLLSLEKLIKKIVAKTRPNCVVLFGSAAKGEDTEKSDIDLFVQSRRQEVNANKTEKLLNRKINLLFEPEIKKLGKELRNNLANGIVVYGFFEVVK